MNDITQVLDADKIPYHLINLAEIAQKIGNSIKSSQSRTDKSIAYSNFCSYISSELRQASLFYPKNVAGLAWNTRNLFETNLIIKHIKVSEQNLKLWLGQALKDEKDYLNGILNASTDQSSESNRKTIQDRLTHLEQLSKKYGLSFATPFILKDLAIEHGLLTEYTSLYKLFSKYVHPSSLLINAWHQHAPTEAWTNIFLTKLQLYSGNSVHLIAEEFGIIV